MKLCKNDGNQHIPVSMAIEVELEEAYDEIEVLPTADEIDDAFVGVVNDKSETAYFIRHSDNVWDVQVPVKTTTGSTLLRGSGLTTETVKEVVDRFYHDQEWRSLCGLRGNC